MALLELEDVVVHYGPVEALKGVTLSVEEGAIVTLIGGNGAGKTTTLKTISGLRKPTRGTITFDGEPIHGMAPHELVKRGLGHAPEGRGIFPGMTVMENLGMGAYLRKGSHTADYDRVFELFPRLAERRSQSGGTLSGGEQQMLAIGRALMTKPKLLLLDEPSMGLAPLLVAQIFTIISAINEQGTTVLLVEQNAAQALRRAQFAYVLETGSVVRAAPAEELLADDSVRNAYLGGDIGESGGAETGSDDG